MANLKVPSLRGAEVFGILLMYYANSLFTLDPSKKKVFLFMTVRDIDHVLSDFKSNSTYTKHTDCYVNYAA